MAKEKSKEKEYKFGKMIITSECEDCIYGSVDERNKARVKVLCSLKDKEYYFGQCIPCDNLIKRDRDNTDKDESEEK